MHGNVKTEPPRRKERQVTAKIFIVLKRKGAKAAENAEDFGVGD